MSFNLQTYYQYSINGIAQSRNPAGTTNLPLWICHSVSSIYIPEVHLIIINEYSNLSTKCPLETFCFPLFRSLPLKFLPCQKIFNNKSFSRRLLHPSLTLCPWKETSTFLFPLIDALMFNKKDLEVTVATIITCRFDLRAGVVMTDESGCDRWEHSSVLDRTT